MKHVSKLLILSMVFMFGVSSVFAQQEIVVDNITNSVDNNTLIAGQSHTISLRVRNLAPAACATTAYNPNNGFVLTSPDGATWNSTLGSVSPIFVSAHNWFTQGINHFEDPIAGGDNGAPDNDGVSPDYLVFFAASVSVAGGMQNGYDEISYLIDIQTNLADSNLTICIDQSALGRLNTFLWAGITDPVCNVVPTFNQHCMTIFDVPNIPPVCTTSVITITGAHCDAFSQQFEARDDEGDAITWSLGAGSPGSITPGGMWTWNAASLGDVGTSITLTAIPSDARPGTPCVVNVVVTNDAPVITCPAVGVTVQTGDTKTQQVTASDTDACDALSFSIVNAGGASGASINASTGVVTYSPVDGVDDALAQPVVMTIEVTDGLVTAQCNVEWNVIAGAPFTVAMSDISNAIPGTFNTVEISLGAIDVNAGLGGFDFKVGYDQSALSFQRADKGQIYVDCGWEYFTYRVVSNAVVHLIGIADQNDGPNHPGCATPTPYVNTLPVSLASMTFLSSNNSGFNGMCVPIRFLWQDCGDNILSDAVGEALLGAKVFDAGNATPISDPSASLPTFLGMPTSCANATSATRQVDYTNGQLCFGAIGPQAGRGDINVNGLPNEIADVVMFTNFFVTGLSAFLSHVPQSIAASDANADGLTLTVADLVYMIRVVVGDAPAIPKVSPVVATYTIANNVVNVDGAMGAAYVVIKGDVVPELLANNMELAYGYDGDNTKVLIYNMNDRGASFEGDFLRVTGEVLSVELATYDGAPVAAKELPANYALAQNYPNPFNPATVISMSLPLAGEYNLTVYNVTGQVVAEFNGASEAGVVLIEWDASKLASGVYFYKMVAGEFTATKKAVLLK